ncbi:MAG: hypothetical protein N4A36_03085 [Candidatus Gracilibacteria bacterium]|jgi:hypothetical protein|nr:hypothetical protein [Candidatus Gracilibacteria bacterium]
MEIQLSWDLFIIVFFVIIVAYSYIIGKYQTLKIILSSYIAILSADAIGSLIEKYMIGESPIINIATVHSSSNALIFIKIITFIFLTILLATKGGFGIVASQERSRFSSFLLTMTYGILSAGLIISTILVYISGASLVDLTSVTENPLSQISEQSQLVRLMIKNYNAWFSLPVVVFLISSFLGDSPEGS